MSTPEKEVLHRYQCVLAAQAEPTQSLVDDLNTVFATHWDYVFGACYRIMRDRDRASDLAQDTMLMAVDRLRQYQGRASFRTWLYTIARSLCFRSMRRPGELLIEDGVIDTEEPAANVLKQMTRSERATLLQAVMAATLTAEEQEAVYLRYVEGLPQERITDLLENPGESGARGVLQRCRRKLQRELTRRLAELGHGSSFARTSP